ncbi:MAG: YfiR family protein [Oleispira sp.]|nr:YfiR family protein [Oleispira sp.]
MSSTEAEQYPNEYQEKATYLYQIVKFIDWPELNRTNRPIHFCVFGKDPFRGALNNIHLRKVKERALQISYINQDFQIAHCNILFVQKKIEEGFIPQHYSLIIKNNILTIGEDAGFAKNGGIIRITLIDHKLRVEINLQAAEDAHIKIHSNLIEIASQLYQRGQS